MSNDIFRFKQFSVRHDRCAMKVGTDGVLLGAWGSVEGKRILDIGTGTGLIALMAAQRNPEADVLGIDIDELAVAQARGNVAESPFNRRIECILQDVLTFESEAPFDAILCNPPFFTEDTLPDNRSRALARNNKCLPFPQLIKKVAVLLAENGTFSLIVPSGLVQEIVFQADSCKKLSGFAWKTDCTSFVVAKSTQQPENRPAEPCSSFHGKTGVARC